MVWAPPGWAGVTAAAGMGGLMPWRRRVSSAPPWPRLAGLMVATWLVLAAVAVVDVGLTVRSGASGASHRTVFLVAAAVSTGLALRAVVLVVREVLHRTLWRRIGRELAAVSFGCLVGVGVSLAADGSLARLGRGERVAAVAGAGLASGVLVAVAAMGQAVSWRRPAPWVAAAIGGSSLVTLLGVHGCTPVVEGPWWYVATSVALTTGLAVLHRFPGEHLRLHRAASRRQILESWRSVTSATGVCVALLLLVRGPAMGATAVVAAVIALAASLEWTRRWVAAGDESWHEERLLVELSLLLMATEDPVEARDLVDAAMADTWPAPRRPRCVSAPFRDDPDGSGLDATRWQELTALVDLPAPGELQWTFAFHDRWVAVLHDGVGPVALYLLDGVGPRAGRLLAGVVAAGSAALQRLRTQAERSQAAGWVEGDANLVHPLGRAVILRRDGLVAYSTAEARTLLRWVGDRPGEDLAAVFVDADRRALAALMTLATPTEPARAVVGVHAGGTVIEVEVQCLDRRDDPGLGGWVVLLDPAVRPVAPRDGLELLALKARVSTLSPIGMMVVDADSEVIVHANPAARRLLGPDRALVGRSGTSLLRAAVDPAGRGGLTIQAVDARHDPAVRAVLVYVHP